MKRILTLDLIAQTPDLDSIRQQVMAETRRTVYAKVLDIHAAEWDTAQQKSLSPAYHLSVFFADFRGESVAEVAGKRYEVYRTHGSGDYIELYLGERVGEIRA